MSQRMGRWICFIFEGSCIPSLSGLTANCRHDKMQGCCSCRLPLYWSTWMVDHLEMSCRRQVLALLTDRTSHCLTTSHLKHAIWPPISCTNADVAPRLTHAKQTKPAGPHIISRRICYSLLMLQVTAVPEAALAAIAAQLLPGLVHLHRKSHMVLSQPQSQNSIGCMHVCWQPCTDAQVMYTRLSAYMLSCCIYCSQCAKFFTTKSSHCSLDLVRVLSAPAKV